MALIVLHFSGGKVLALPPWIIGGNFGGELNTPASPSSSSRFFRFLISVFLRITSSEQVPPIFISSIFFFSKSRVYCIIRHNIITSQ